jgi:hypothetical protein
MDRSSLEHLCDRCGIKTSGKSMVCWLVQINNSIYIYI